MDIGQRIASARGKMTQEELSKLLNTSRTHISQIERNKVSPTLRTLEKLATALKTTSAVLIGTKQNEPSSGLLDLLEVLPDDDIRCLERIAMGLASLRKGISE